MNACPYHSAALRPSLPQPVPARIAALPVDERGYPVPWFVQWLDEQNGPVPAGQGRPEFRMMDGSKLVRAYRGGLCWVCGQKRTEKATFLIGPMCGISGTTSEPPSHYECAEWSVRACPFLTKPKMVRREDAMTIEYEKNIAGEHIDRNPGVTLMWTSRTYRAFKDHQGRPLFNVGEPIDFCWWCEGRAATRAEVMESVNSGLPSLQEFCEKEETDVRRRQARRELDKLVTAFIATRVPPK